MALDKLQKAERFLDKFICETMKQLPGYEALEHVYPDYSFSQSPQCGSVVSYTFAAVAGCAEHKRIMGNGWIHGWNSEEWGGATLSLHCSLDHGYYMADGHGVGGEVIAILNEANKSSA